MIDKLLKVDSTKDNVVDQIQDLQERMAELERFALTSQDIVATKIECSGDIYTVEWTDYSALSTIVGWTSYTIKKIFYKKIGKLVFVQFDIEGVSDDTVATFTLPYSQQSDLKLVKAAREIDDGAADIGFYTLAAGGSTVTCYPDIAGSAWANSGNKYVYDQFLFETD